MWQRLSSLLLAGLLLQTFAVAPARAQSPSGDEARRVSETRASFARLGTGERARVTVWLKTGEKLKGYVSRAEESGVVIADAKTKRGTNVSYADVARVERQRGGLSRGAIIGIISAAAGAVVLAAVLTPVLTDGGAR